MIQSPHITKIPSERPRSVFISCKRGAPLHRRLEAMLGGQIVRPPVSVTNPRPPVAPPSDGLRTPAEAARKLGCSTKTLLGYVKSGALKYVAIGHGKRRTRKMFSDADLAEFIQVQTRKDAPCPSIRTETAARRSSISTSRSKVLGFMEARSRRRDAKPKL